MQIEHRQAKLLLVGEEDDFVLELEKYLLADCFLVRLFVSGKRHKIDLAETLSVDAVVVVSTRQNSLDGISTVERIRAYGRNIPVFFVARYGSEKKAVAALRSGVTDYYSVPYAADALARSIRHHLHDLTSIFELSGVEKNNADNSGPDLVGVSKEIKEIRNYLLRVAAKDSTVLITGETGTGKKLAADFIYWHSRRRNYPFVRINSSAMSEPLVESKHFECQKGALAGADADKRSKFELADKGTLFLDEISEMSSVAQSEILRVLERKRVHRLGSRNGINVDIRIIAATNQDIERRVKEGLFRKDLFFRLNVAHLHLPPLRERREDIPILLYKFMHEFNDSFGLNVTGFSEKAWFCLLKYEWPGNIRELQNVLEATYINAPSSTITFENLPRSFQKKFYSSGFKPKSERDKVLSALFAANWNKSRAAHNLNCSRMTLYRKMAKHQIVHKRSVRRQFVDLHCDA